MFETIVIGLLAFPVGIIYASLAEWVIHRWLMHRPLLRFSHFYVGHAKIHHGIYQADETYVLGDRPAEDLTLAWWAMPLPILSQVPLLLVLAAWVGLPFGLGVFVAFTVYQTSYEYLHYVMHVPRGRWVERTAAFQWINAHHFQHHRKHGTNLNVVLPLADFLFGTHRRSTEAVPA
jgi:hypothetical protein